MLKSLLVLPWYACPRISVRSLSAAACARKQSSSSKRWLERQHKDQYTLKAKHDDYKSRAAYKLKEMNDKFRLFRPGMTVVDLGFAPGSWSQVAYESTRPHGRVIGVDMIPATPPKGVTTIQGNFLSTAVQNELRQVLANPLLGRTNKHHDNIFVSQEEADEAKRIWDLEQAKLNEWKAQMETKARLEKLHGPQASDPSEDQVVDVVLSDMCGITPQESGFWVTSINYPYYRLANTSGLVARDHAASMDLCDAALVFAIRSLKPGGSFICKFYTGEEDKALQERLKKVFKLVRRAKPDATRQASREMYFIARKKRQNVTLEDIYPEMVPGME